MTEFRRLAIPDLIEAIPARHGDNRGYFSEVWKAEEWEAQGVGVRWIQESVDGIIALPLSDADDLWADAVIRAAQHDRGAIRSSFDQSEFGIDVAMERFHELWGIPVSPESHAVIDTGGS